MKTSRYVLYASAVAAVLALALIVSFGLRGRNQVAATASPTSPTNTTSPATPAPTAATASPTAPAVGVITGGLSFPADFIPPTTVYAVSVADQRVFFSVDTPRYGGGPGSPPSATIPPGGPTYTITGVAPGTYYVFAYRNDNDPNNLGGPALYSQFVLKCIQPSLAGIPIPPGACDSNSADHSLVPVTVRPGETMSRIDPKDWTTFQQVQQGNLPPRPR